MISRFVIVIALGALCVGCGPRKDINVVTSPSPSTKARSEPVIYNGRPYVVDFKYSSAQGAFNVKVSGGSGRKLGGKPGDKAIVEQIASSTVRHFACRDGQKGKIVPGSSHHDGKAWAMRAQCV